jgi:hypothetical protein
MALDEETRQKVDFIDKLGNKLKGEAWTTYINAISRDVGGLSEQDVQVIVNNVDPVAAVERAGMQSLLNQMPSGVRASNDRLDPTAVERQRQSERDYNEIRRAQREAYARSKGRIR